MSKIAEYKTNESIINYGLYINLNKTDIYSRSTFEELQNQRFNEGLDYYILVVREQGRVYLFDAAGFIEHCVHDHQVIQNPITRREIQEFSVYVSKPESPDFQLYMTGGAEVVKVPHHLPILWSDLSKDLADRWSFMLAYGRHFESSNPGKAVEIYEMAAEAGSTVAKLRLAKIYSERGEAQSAIKRLKECIKAEDISTQNVFACARLFMKYQKPALAFQAYSISATRGNQIGLVAVIRHLEGGIGVVSDQAKIAEWRQKLPSGWKDASMATYMQHLKSLNYTSGQEGFLNFTT